MPRATPFPSCLSASGLCANQAGISCAGGGQSTGFFQRSSTGTTVVSLISSMTKEAETSESATLAISRW